MANFWERDTPATQDFWAKDTPIEPNKPTGFWSKDEAVKSQEPIDFSIPTERALRTSSVTPSQEPSTLEKIAGSVEVPAAIVGSLAGGLYGVVNKALRGQTTPENLGFEEGAQAVAPVTAPQTRGGQAALEAFGEFSDRYLTPLAGLNEIAALSRLAPVKGMPSTFQPREIPVVGEAIQGAETAGKAVVSPVVRGAKKLLAPSEETKLKQYNKVLDDFEAEAADAVTKGINVDEIKPYVLNKLGLPEERLAQAMSNTNRELPLPKSMAEAEAVSQIKKLGDYQEAGFLSKALQPIQTRLQQISENAANRLGRYEFNLHNNTQKYLSDVNPFLLDINRLDKPVADKIALDLFNGKFADVRNTLKEVNPAAVENFNKTESVLKNIYQELKDSGYKDLGQIESYFPRRINDLEKLYEALGVKSKGQIESLLENKAQQLKISREDLTDEQVADTVNKYLRGYGQKTGSGKPFFTKSRNISEVNEKILPFYSSPVDSLQTYIRSAVNNIEKNKFFGKNAVIDNGQKLNLDSSIGNFVAKDLAGSTQMADEVTALLRARFNMGERAPSKAVRAAKDIIYAATIANPKSALSQLADVGVSNFVNGSKNAIASLVGSKAVTVEDLGLAEISAELNTAKGTSKALNKLLQISGFKAIDKLGKETFINSSLSKARALAKNEQGLTQLRGKYGKVFGNEFDSFANDLKTGKITDNVKYYLFSELADVQPVTLSQLPRYYLENPNGRMLYALKSFTIKQMDVMKKYIYDEYKRGNKKQAVKNAAAFITLVGGANTAVDELKKVIETKSISPDDISEDFAFNVLKLLGGSKFVYDKYITQGKWGEAALKTVAPPLDIITAPVEDAIGFLSGKENYTYKTPRRLPLVGWAIYNWFGGGLEKYEQEKQNKQYKAAGF